MKNLSHQICTVLLRTTKNNPKFNVSTKDLEDSKQKEYGWAWWCSPLVPTPESDSKRKRQKQQDLCEFKVYTVSSKTARTT